jgi:NAD(P)-dependent dehydrogenase (short-subunit alcohol dehydrogenase family)
VNLNTIRHQLRHVTTMTEPPLRTLVAGGAVCDVPVGTVRAEQRSRPSARSAPEEIVAAAMFLASDDSSFVAGVELSVDGSMAQV